MMMMLKATFDQTHASAATDKRADTLFLPYRFLQITTVLREAQDNRVPRKITHFKD